MLNGISNFEWKMVKKLSQLQSLLFTGAQQNPNFARRSCSNH
jgi:hypothetical protein